MRQMHVPDTNEAAGRATATSAAAAREGWPLLRWLANFGLSLSAADITVPGPEDRDSACPFAQLFAGVPRKSA